VLLRPAIRALSKRPLLTFAAVATIALGVGANSGVFSVVQGVLLQPLPFRDPGRLVCVWQTHPSLGNLPVSYPDYIDWRAARSFRGLAAYTFQAMNKAPLAGEGAPEQVQATMASRELFPLMGIALLEGRSFTADDENERRHVALISEALWRRKFGASPRLVGRSIRIGPEEFTVIGIVRQREAFPVWADLWLPISLLEPMLRETRRFHPLEVVGRLQDGVSVAEAQSEMTALSANLARQYPATGKSIGAFVIPLLNQVTSSIRPALLIVWMAVGLILLVACANVAHLLLTRTMSRQRELAIRAALGASSIDLLGLLGTECLLLVATGGVFGAALAGLLIPLLKSMAVSYIPRMSEVALDTPVALYTLAGMLFCAALVAIPSLWRVSRADLGASIKQGDAPLFSGRSGRLGPAIMAAEIALAFVVLTGAILLTRSFDSLRQVDPGFRARNVLAMDVNLPSSSDSQSDGGWAAAADLFDNQLAPALRSLPGVVSVASANMSPLSLDRTETSRYASRFGVKGRAYSPGSYPAAQIRWVSPEYFATLGIPLLRGRLLNARDHEQPRWLINETLARRFFTAQDPVGKELLMNVDTPGVSSVEIVGVVGDTRDLSLDVDPQPTIYSIDTSPVVSLLIRSYGDPRLLIPAVTRIVRRAAPEAPITSAQPLEDLVNRSLARYRFTLSLMIGFAALAAALAGIGIYGVVAYAVGRRLREFAVRTAVGATPLRILGLVLSEGLAVAVAGVAAGSLLFAFATRLFRPVLFRVPPSDALSLAASALAVVAIALLAMAVPARRASRADPSVALRAD
jgi:predicted permease